MKTSQTLAPPEEKFLPLILKELAKKPDYLEIKINLVDMVAVVDTTKNDNHKTILIE